MAANMDLGNVAAGADGPAADQAAGPPIPPYTEGTDISEGIPCYYPNCRVKATGWSSLWNHVKKYHGAKLRALVGTYFYRMATLELNQGNRTRWARKKVSAETKTTAGMTARQVEEEGGLGQPSPSTPVWKVLPVWVQCSQEGLPTDPPVYGGVASEVGINMEGPGLHNVPHQLGGEELPGLEEQLPRTAQWWS